MTDRFLRGPTWWALVVLTLGTACGTADDVFCENAGCDVPAREWAQLQSMVLDFDPPPDRSNKYSTDPRAAELGKRLFHDTVFSGPANRKDALGRPVPYARPEVTPGTIGISCATCHETARAGADVTSIPGHVSVGAGWTDVNALPTANSAYNPVVFWNGRADSLWMLTAVVGESGTTMNGTRGQIARALAMNYPQEVSDIFGDHLPPDWFRVLQLPEGPSKPGVPAYDVLPPGEKELLTRLLVDWAKAISAYLQTLVMRDSPFDRFVEEGPDSRILSAAARRGALLFVGKAACVDCHSGPLLTDQSFHNVGVPQQGSGVPQVSECPKAEDPKACDCVEGTNCLPWGAYTGIQKLQESDPAKKSPYLRSGRFSDDPGDDSRKKYMDMDLTEDLKGAWRTPSLRNVALTAPYMHNGIFRTLEEVIWHYNSGGAAATSVGFRDPAIKPLHLTEQEVFDLVAFLESLTGTLQPATTGGGK